MVKGSIGCETRSVINFKDERLSFVVQHYVQTQNMKTHISTIIFRLTALVLVSHEGKPSYDGFYNQILYFQFQFWNVESLVRKLFKNA